MGLSVLNLPIGAGKYNGLIYDNRKNKNEELKIKHYEGAFYTISTSAVIAMLGQGCNKISLDAIIFSSGMAGGLYGYAEGVSTGSFELSIITGAFLYYIKIGEGKNLIDAIKNSESPFWSSEAWNKNISKRLGE